MMSGGIFGATHVGCTGMDTHWPDRGAELKARRRGVCAMKNTAGELGRGRIGEVQPQASGSATEFLSRASF